MNFIYIIFFSLFLITCGFKPVYKLSENNFDSENYLVLINNENSVSSEIKEEIRMSFISKSNEEKNYTIIIDSNEDLVPLIVNSDGTISKYRIEITINFKLQKRNDISYLIDDSVKGFAQYTLDTSEINNNDKKKRMIRSATNEALQIMISKIQSSMIVKDDN